MKQKKKLNEKIGIPIFKQEEYLINRGRWKISYTKVFILLNQKKKSMFFLSIQKKKKAFDNVNWEMVLTI